MEKRKILPCLTVLAVSLLLLCNKANAQLDAQSDLFNVLENSCSYYLDVVVNDTLGSLQIDSLQIFTAPQNGNVFVNGNYISYCPSTSFLGADHFKYKIFGSGFTDSASVYINVLSSNNYIFPGDADQNGKVEIFDVLALGLAYKRTGPSRFDSVSVNALAWSPSPYTSYDPGAADCNGDGIVDEMDLLSIEQSYNDIYPYPPRFDVDTSEFTISGTPFYIQSLSGDTVQDGDTLDIAVKLGNDFSLNEAYGIAFTLEFDNGFVGGNTVQFSTAASWILQNDAGLFFKRGFQGNGEIEIALTRTNHSAVNGGGEILFARMPIDDNIDGIIESPGLHNLNLKLKRTRLISAYNVVRDIYTEQPSLMVSKTSINIIETENSNLRIYPNPASGRVVVEAENIREVEITDVTGRRIYALETEAVNQLSIDLGKLSLASGNYFMKIKTTEFSVTKKIFVQH